MAKVKRDIAYAKSGCDPVPTVLAGTI